MTDRIWLSSYPAGVPADIDAGQYPSLVALMEEAFSKYADRVAYSFMGKEITYAQTDSLSKAFAAYLQGLGLARGDRVAIMMPNVPHVSRGGGGHFACRFCGGERQPAVYPT